MEIPLFAGEARDVSMYVVCMDGCITLSSSPNAQSLLRFRFGQADDILFVFCPWCVRAVFNFG